MKCNTCGSDIKEGALFCDYCGSIVEMDSSEASQFNKKESHSYKVDGDNFGDKKLESIICPHCGFNLPVGSGTCDRCGSVLKIKTYTPHYEDHTNVLGPLKGFISIHKKLIICVTSLVIFLLIVIAIFSQILSMRYKTDGYVGAGSIKTPTPTNINTLEPVPVLDVSRIESIIRNNVHDANVAVCVVDLNHGTTYETSNAQVPMSASALTTLPIIYSADVTAPNLDNSLSDIEIQFKYSTSGRGIMTQSQNGEIFDLDYLIRNLMAYSDNNITNTLMDYFGMQEIGEICAENGYKSITFQRHIGEKIANKDNYISASDAACMLAELYNSGKQINKTYLRNNFIIADSIRYVGLGKYLPSDETFLNHNAFTNETYNEVCIVPDVKNPYVIAFLSNNGEFTTSETVAAKVSEYVYTELNK